MTLDQSLILGILLATVAMFLWGRWRHDMVALGALLACVVAGVVAPEDAFSGFGHPAVITVACVLVLSRGLQTSGAVDALARLVLPEKSGATLSFVALVGLGALLSGFMNNVGAMALLMPVAIRMAKRLDLAAGQVLMPLAFGTGLGGMTTLIGTPPNLIVSGFRAQNGAAPFGMFDFTPVGLGVAVAGAAFIALVGWRLVPARKQSGIEGFESGSYLTEARVPEGSKAVDKTLREIEQSLEESGAQVVGLVRNDLRMTAPHANRRIRVGDILVVEAEAEALSGVLSRWGLKLEEAKRPDHDDDEPESGERAERKAAAPPASGKAAAAPPAAGNAATAPPASGKAGAADGDAAEGAKAASEVALMELAVLPNSSLVGNSARNILLRTRYGLNLLALSRQGQRSMARLRAAVLQPGDLLLMQGSPDAILEFAADYGCVPLAERELHVPSRRKAWQAGIIMAVAVALVAFGLLPAAISFALGVLASLALRTVPPRAVYDAVDWPVIVLLGALIPVARAMEATGAADLIARLLLDNVAQGHAVVALAVLLVLSMLLSDLMNNAATAAVMCPIAIGTAAALGASADAYLMAVATGASCAFLTPIGHQNNTLILGPGGFRFADYWRLGLPLDLVVATTAIPLLLLVWPL